MNIDMRLPGKGWLAALAMALVVACGGGGGTGGSGEGGTTTGGHDDLPITAGRTLATPLRGLTTESVDNLSALVDSVGAHTRVPTVRVVFQPDLDVADYATALDQLRPKAYLMGELLDSTALSSFTPDQVRQRATDFYNAYGDKIDLWEIGNELNGEWVGSGPDEINAKLQAAYDVIKKEHGAKTMITLNYWSGPDCYAQPWEPTVTYAQSIPEEIRNGVDYVSLSIYETACSPRQEPTAAEIAAVLNQFATIFPNAKLAIGEVGAQRASDGVADPDLAEKQRIANKYYGMQSTLASRVGSRFVGGYFWWYYGEDAVPRTKSGTLWPTLDTLFQQF